MATLELRRLHSNLVLVYKILPSDEKHARRVFVLFCHFVRKPFEISKLLQWTAIQTVGMGFPATPKLAHLGFEK